MPARKPPSVGPDTEFEVVEIPRPLPLGTKVSRRAKAVIAAGIASPILAILAIIIAATSASSPTATHSTPDYAGVGETVVAEWLGGDPITVPHSSGLGPFLGRELASFSSSSGPVAIPTRSIAFVGARHEQVNGLHYVTDTYLVVSPDLGTVDVAVTMETTPRGAVVVASPAVTPYTSTAAAHHLAYPSDSPTQAMVTQIDAWASAYASNDESALYNLAGATTQVHYRGLSGVALISTPTVNSCEIPVKITASSTAICQVSLELGVRSNHKLAWTASYDLLLGRLTAALPTVVAWGPPGSGSSLSPGENALPGLAAAG